MEFKVQIKCESCKCCFEIRPAKFNAEAAISCPNCGESIPDDIANDLKTGIVALGKVPDSFPDDASLLFSPEGFSFSVKEITNPMDKVVSSD